MLQNLDTYSLDIELAKKMLSQNCTQTPTLATMSASDKQDFDDAMMVLQELVEMSEMYGSSKFSIQN